jgi:hypothetical protein
MTNAFFEFRWEVPAAGFSWLEARPDLPPRPEPPRRDWYLVANATAKESKSSSYDPFAVEPPLFRIFAATPPYKDDVLKFASKYGSLAMGKRIRRIAREKRSVRRSLFKGVSLTTFRTQITVLRRMVNLWDLCRAGDTKGLAQHVIWTGDHSVVYKDPDFVEDITPSPWSEWLQRLPTGDVVIPALIYLQTVINEHLQWCVSPRLLWDPRAGVLEVCVQPQNLQDMLWLQFAGTVKGKLAYHPCLSCGRWIRVGQDGVRVSRHYCSNACRTRALRDRQDKARKLLSLGMSTHQIADHLNIDEASVAKWVYSGSEEES